jgi:flagellin-specific chaperone FliS
LSLLYRGALYHLQQEQGLAISRSMTEAECLNLVKKIPDVYSYLSEIVSTWQRFAYAHQSPQDNKIEELCAAWTEHFKHA